MSRFTFGPKAEGSKWAKTFRVIPENGPRIAYWSETTLEGQPFFQMAYRENNSKVVLMGTTISDIVHSWVIIPSSEAAENEMVDNYLRSRQNSSRSATSTTAVSVNATISSSSSHPNTMTEHVNVSPLRRRHLQSNQLM